MHTGIAGAVEDYQICDLNRQSETKSRQQSAPSTCPHFSALFHGLTHFGLAQRPRIR